MSFNTINTQSTNPMDDNFIYRNELILLHASRLDTNGGWQLLKNTDSNVGSTNSTSYIPFNVENDDRIALIQGQCIIFVKTVLNIHEVFVLYTNTAKIEKYFNLVKELIKETAQMRFNEEQCEQHAFKIFFYWNQDLSKDFVKFCPDRRQTSITNQPLLRSQYVYVYNLSFITPQVFPKQKSAFAQQMEGWGQGSHMSPCPTSSPQTAPAVYTPYTSSFYNQQKPAFGGSFQGQMSSAFNQQSSTLTSPFGQYSRPGDSYGQFSQQTQVPQNNFSQLPGQKRGFKHPALPDQLWN